MKQVNPEGSGDQIKQIALLPFCGELLVTPSPSCCPPPRLQCPQLSHLVLDAVSKNLWDRAMRDSSEATGAESSGGSVEGGGFGGRWLGARASLPDRAGRARAAQARRRTQKRGKRTENSENPKSPKATKRKRNRSKGDKKPFTRSKAKTLSDYRKESRVCRKTNKRLKRTNEKLREQVKKLQEERAKSRLDPYMKARKRGARSKNVLYKKFSMAGGYKLSIKQAASNNCTPGLLSNLDLATSRQTVMNWGKKLATTLRFWMDRSGAKLRTHSLTPPGPAQPCPAERKHNTTQHTLLRPPLPPIAD